MSDTTDDDTTPETPTAAPAASEAPVVAPPTVPTQTAVPPAATQRVGLAVPSWLVGLVALLAVGALGFGLARWTDSGHGDRGRPPAGAIQQGPGGGGNRAQGQNGPGNQGQNGPSVR